jgi:choline kinase
MHALYAEQQSAVREAVILMAGIGSRLAGAGGALAKPLVPIAGRALICYTFDAFERAEIDTVHAVMGANSEQLIEQIAPLVPRRMRFNPIINHDWQKQNGVSVLAAAGHVKPPFFLVMGDHLFEPSILDALDHAPDDEVVRLAVDRKVDSIFDLDDAMKVRTAGDRIVAIAKDLRDYDAIDTGVFRCPAAIFTYLRRAQRDGDCSLADGIRLMATEQQARVVDIGDAWWQDVDTPEMLARAEQESARLLRQSRSRLPEKSVAGEGGAHA